MNAYWIVLPLLSAVLGFGLDFKDRAMIWIGAALVAFDLFAATVVTLGDYGILF